MHSILSGYSNREQYLYKIIRAWCYIGETGRRINKISDYCLIFYYWLGKILIDELKVNSFQDTMGRIYNALATVHPIHECKIIYSDITQEQFKHLEKLACYDLDKANIEKGIGDTKCQTYRGRYRQCLQNVEEAYNSMKEECAYNNDEGYCTKFQENLHRDGHFQNQNNNHHHPNQHDQKVLKRVKPLFSLLQVVRKLLQKVLPDKMLLLHLVERLLNHLIRSILLLRTRYKLIHRNLEQISH
ncbi:KIR protein [Plasmodium coatneyi]|uniref:KIR protein n=1 Tax=Plasmodium coatneyi TaxID=208452 RepID=A0A1B1DTZ2_9APIC|nr:KIR protein [Plasmodium coatneyi]ANQ06222.1 KIR protein [Plasmodium coatneyi]